MYYAYDVYENPVPHSQDGYPERLEARHTRSRTAIERIHKTRTAFSRVATFRMAPGAGSRLDLRFAINLAQREGRRRMPAKVYICYEPHVRLGGGEWIEKSETN